MKRNSKRKGPRVSFDRDRLAAAARAWRVSQKQLAGQLDEKVGTINYMFLKGKQCSEASLEEISEILHVPFEWLTGEEDHLPLQPFQRDNPYRSIAETHFVIECNCAYERDLRHCPTDDERAGMRREQGVFIFALYALLDPRRWWWAFMDFRARLEPEDWGSISELPIPAETETETIEAMINGMRKLLMPWLDGFAALEYKKVIELARIV